MERAEANDLVSFQKFLDTFCKSLSEETEERDGLPIRIFNHHCLFEEIEGECIDWCLRYLATRKCPPTLTSALTRAAVDEVLQSDLSQYEEESGKEDDHNKDNGQALIEDQSKDLVFDAEALCDYVVEVLENTCKKWKTDLPHFSIPSSVHQVSFHEIKNTRRKMEDRHVILPDLNSLFNLKDQPQQSYYAVFDGHAGVDAAVYASSQLHCRLVNCESFAGKPQDAFKCAYKVTDEKFISKAQRERLKSGSTGVSILIRDNNLHIAWLGDSQAVLVRNGEAITIMDPHKPEREDEKARIEALGGCVMFMGAWRVNGNLAVSRSIGDVNHKKFITSDADTNTIKLDGTEDYMVLACDGLWDVLDAKDLPGIMFTYLQESNRDRSLAANHLVTWARDNGSTDNITVIVVFLRDDIAPPQVVKQTFNFGEVDTQEPNEENGDQFDSSKDTPRDKKPDDSNVNGENSSNGPSDALANEKQELDHVTTNHYIQDTVRSNLSVSDDFVLAVDEEDCNIQKVHLENVGSISLPKDHVLRKKEEIFIVTNSPPRIERENVLDSVAKIQLPNFKDSIRSRSVPPINTTSDQFLVRRGSLTNRNIPQELRNEIQTLSHREQLAPLKEIIRQKRNRKQKKNKKDRNTNKESSLNALRKITKRSSQLDPVVWSFAGKIGTPLPNYKLNMAAKSVNTPSNRIALATMYHNPNNDQLPQSTGLTSVSSSSINSDSYILEKLLKNRRDQERRNSENIATPNPLLPLSSLTLKNHSTSHYNPPAVTGKVKDPAKASKKFKGSWRPRKQTRVIGGIMQDVPPSPLGLVKLAPQPDTVDD